MDVVFNEATVVAAIEANFKLFKKLLDSGQWKPEYGKDCVEIITNVSDLKHGLRALLGIDRADKLVSDAYDRVFPRQFDRQWSN